MLKILIAEDETFIANLYKEELEAQHMQITIVYDGKEAVRQLAEQKFDLVLLDLLMPEADGFAVLEWLQKHKTKNGNIPVIVLTNLDQKLYRKKCEQLGACAYIVKSDVEAAEIVALVKKYLLKK